MAYLLKIRYPSWQSFAELPRTDVKLVSDDGLSVEVEVTAIKDIPITTKDDVIYLYIGTTGTNNKDHTTTVSIHWIKNSVSLRS